MADLPDGAYRRFVCVETANAADEVVTLLPGQAHTLAVTVGVRHDTGR
jgi:glucose-6-phosphate 1-epimerase